MLYMYLSPFFNWIFCSHGQSLKMDTEMEDLTPKTQGIDLTFRNVTVARNSKVILSSISGHARPGELLAIMGPSGT